MLCTLLHADIGWCTIACPARGKSGFGMFSDNGLNLVPAKLKKSQRPKKSIKENPIIDWSKRQTFNIIINLSKPSKPTLPLRNRSQKFLNQKVETIQSNQNNTNAQLMRSKNIKLQLCLIYYLPRNKDKFI